MTAVSAKRALLGMAGWQFHLSGERLEAGGSAQTGEPGNTLATGRKTERSA